MSYIFVSYISVSHIQFGDMRAYEVALLDLFRELGRGARVIGDVFVALVGGYTKHPITSWATDLCSTSPSCLQSEWRLQ
jgi:hypothetical protein